MTGSLRIAEGLALPSDAVTQTFGILAVRGAGKSNTGAVMAEEMARARLPFVVVDPVGSWWGLRSSGDGQGDACDTDDDNDAVADTQDQLEFDPQNGSATALPLGLEWNPSDPAYGKVANSGFTGVQISSNATRATLQTA